MSEVKNTRYTNLLDSEKYYDDIPKQYIFNGKCNYSKFLGLLDVIINQLNISVSPIWN